VACYTKGGTIGIARADGHATRCGRHFVVCGITPAKETFGFWKGYGCQIIVSVIVS